MNYSHKADLASAWNQELHMWDHTYMPDNWADIVTGDNAERFQERPERVYGWLDESGSTRVAFILALCHEVEALHSKLVDAENEGSLTSEQMYRLLVLDDLIQKAEERIWNSYNLEVRYI